MSAQTQEEKRDAFLNLPVPRAVAKFAIPTILSQLVTLLYNLADTFFVDRKIPACSIEQNWRIFIVQ